MASWLGSTEIEKQVVFVIGSVPQYLHDGDFFDWLYLPMRWISVARPQDVLVLPDLWPMREYVAFLELTLFQGKNRRIIWVPAHDYLLDSMIVKDSKTLSKLQKLARQRALFFPYSSITKEFQQWFSQLEGACLLGESSEWGNIFATKAWLHPYAGHLEFQSLAQQLGIPILPGYNASYYEELMYAWKLLSKQGILRVGIKPLQTAFGNGITPLLDRSTDQIERFIRQYTFSYGPVMIEQWVEIDHDDLGEVSWSTHYLRQHLFAPPTRQLVDHGTSGGNITEGFDSICCQQLNEITEIILQAIVPCGMGGFNGPYVNRKPYLTDINVGRSTGVCSSLAFRESFCSQMVTVNRKLGKPSMSIFEAWKRLETNGIAFDCQSGVGVFIQGWIPSGWSQVIACAETQDNAFELLAKTRESLQM